jgi:hypothetical protein
MHERLPARPDSVARLRHAVVGFAGRRGASIRRREDIALAVSEALSNIVLHAYAGSDRPGAIDVRASVSDAGAALARQRPPPHAATRTRRRAARRRASRAFPECSRFAAGS